MTASRPRIAQGHRKDTGHPLRSARSAAKRLQPDEPPRRSTARDPLPEPGTELELDGGSKEFGCIAFGLEASNKGIVQMQAAGGHGTAMLLRNYCPDASSPADRIVPDASERTCPVERFRQDGPFVQTRVVRTEGPDRPRQHDAITGTETFWPPISRAALPQRERHGRIICGNVVQTNLGIRKSVTQACAPTMKDPASSDQPMHDDIQRAIRRRPQQQLSLIASIRIRFRSSGDRLHSGHAK